MKAAVMGIGIAALAITTSAFAQQSPASTPSGSTPSGSMSFSAGTSGVSGNARANAPNSAQPQDTDRTEGKIAVTVKDPEPEHRTASIEWNPLSLVTLGKLSFNVVITPGEHHALILSPHYQWAETAPIFKFADPNNDPGATATSRVGMQHFKALGGEIGYRYYAGSQGMRGWFIGPSLIVDGVWANPLNGPMKKFADLGLAVDTGYQVVIADNLTLGLGVGLQGMLTTIKVPDQQFPAHTIANREIDPRVLLSFGWAF